MTKTETLTEMARDEWLDLSVEEAVQYAHDHDCLRTSRGGVAIVDLTAAEEHFVDAWVEREWDHDFHSDRDERV